MPNPCANPTRHGCHIRPDCGAGRTASRCARRWVYPAQRRGPRSALSSRSVCRWFAMSRRYIWFARHSARTAGTGRRCVFARWTCGPRPLPVASLGIQMKKSRRCFRLLFALFHLTALPLPICLLHRRSITAPPRPRRYKPCCGRGDCARKTTVSRSCPCPFHV